MVYPILPQSSFHLLNAKANDLPKKNREIKKSKVLHILNVLTKTVANLIDGNVPLCDLSHIPDNFQSVTEIVFDCLPKPSRVNIVTKENLIMFFGAAKYFWSKT